MHQLINTQQKGIHMKKSILILFLISIVSTSLATKKNHALRQKPLVKKLQENQNDFTLCERAGQAGFCLFTLTVALLLTEDDGIHQIAPYRIQNQTAQHPHKNFVSKH